MEIIIQESEITSIREITPTEFNVAQINTIPSKYPSTRQDGKAPTFALTFGGTHFTLMRNCGFSEEEAKSIEENYHKLYVESDQWIKRKLDECCKVGYATAAFGLRIRTPVLARSILNNSVTANISSSEARSVGNAISGQSYGLLNNRAAVAFMEKVWKSEYKYDILPVALIHDASYFLIKDDIEVLKFVNDNLITEMAWQELPEIAHDRVKLESELDVHYISWSQPITLPNDADEATLKSVVVRGVTKYKAPTG